MIVKPRIRGFICTTAHPTGCAAHVQEQINYVANQGTAADDAFKNVLVLGCSGGYGLASRASSNEAIDFDTLDNISNAGRRFDWLCRQLATA